MSVTGAPSSTGPYVPGTGKYHSTERDTSNRARATRDRVSCICSLLTSMDDRSFLRSGVEMFGGSDVTAVLRGLGDGTERS